MANVSHSQRTFTKFIPLDPDASLTVSCVDSLGNLISCNYVAANMATTGAGNAGLIVSPNVGAAKSVTAIGIANLSSTNATSGALGFTLISDGAAGASPLYEYMCLGNEKFTTITLQSIGTSGTAAGKMNVGLTYGTLKESNANRTNDRYQYPLGS